MAIRELAEWEGRWLGGLLLDELLAPSEPPVVLATGGRRGENSEEVEVQGKSWSVLLKRKMRTSAMLNVQFTGLLCLFSIWPLHCCKSWKLCCKWTAYKADSGCMGNFKGAFFSFPAWEVRCWLFRTRTGTHKKQSYSVILAVSV